MTWKEHSARLMRQVETQCRANGCSDAALILESIDAAYPYGQRTNFVYKAWLQARREWMTRHGLKVRESAKHPRHKASESFVCPTHKLICKGVCLLCSPAPTGMELP